MLPLRTNRASNLINSRGFRRWLDLTPTNNAGQAGSSFPGFRAPAGDDRPYPIAGPATWGNCKAMVDLKGKHYFGDIDWLQ